jgi:hypothetical protein
MESVPDPSAATSFSRGDSPPACNPLLTWIAVLLITASAMLVLFHIQPTSRKNVNTASRFATVESLVERGTYAIDQSRYKFTVDKVKLGGRFYSSKPPMIPTYTAGVYFLYNKITGHTFKTHEREAVFVCTLATGWLSHVVTLIYLFRMARRLLRRDLAVLGVVTAGAWAYLGVGYATHLNNHTIAAAAVLVGFFHAHCAAERQDAHLRHWLVSGLCFGFVPTFDIPAATFSAAAFVYLLLANWRKTLLLFVPAALPGIALHLWMMESIYGSVLPVQIRKEAHQYTGSYFWKRRAGIDALREPKYLYAFHALIGHHGLLSMTPLFLFSLAGLARNLRRRVPMFREALFVAASTILLTLFYVYWTRNYGGWSVGFRWFIPFMPLLVLFFGVWLDGARIQRWKLPLVTAAFAVSAYNTSDAVSGPFQFSRWHNWLESAPGRNRTDIEAADAARGVTPKKRRSRK